MQWELAIDRGIQVCLAGLIPFEILLSHHSIPRSSSLLSRFGEHVGVADRMGDRVARIQQKFLHFFFSSKIILPSQMLQNHKKFSR